MKVYSKIVFAFLLCLFTFTANAQISNPASILKRKLEQKLNDRINKKIDEKVDSLADKAIESKVDRIGKIMDFDVKPKSSYAFTSSVLQKVTSIKKAKTETIYMKMLFSKDQPTIGMRGLDKDKVEESEKGILIMDLEQKAFFTFAIDKKGAKNYFGLRLKEQPIEEAETSKTPTKSEKTFTKTGKTKTIMGYSCEGYQMDSDNGNTTIMWVTSSNVAGMDDYYKAMRQYSSQQKQNSSFVMTKPISEWAKQGKAVLGNDYINKNGDQTISELEKITLSDPSDFKTEGYKSAFGK